MSKPTDAAERRADAADAMLGSTEHFETRSKKGRGKARASLDLIGAMRAAAQAAEPITGRGIGYKLFTLGLIPSMATSARWRKVYRLLKQAREQGVIPWDWIVDETRTGGAGLDMERSCRRTRCAVAYSYRRDFWDQQPLRVEVWSEKGTIRGVLQPVLDEYAVGFTRAARLRQRHHRSTAPPSPTTSDRLIVLYVGDWDPSGLCMSERRPTGTARAVRR